MQIPLLNPAPRREVGVLLKAPVRTPSKEAVKAAFSQAGCPDSVTSIVEHAAGDFTIRTRLKELNIISAMKVADILGATSATFGIYRGNFNLHITVG